MPPKVGSSAATVENEALDRGLRHLDVEHVDIGEFLEEDGLALHHRLGGERPDVAEAQYCRTVGDDAHQIGAAGVFRDQRRIGMDRLGDGGHTRRIGQRHVALVAERLGGADLEFSGLRFRMIDQRA